jgi:hypothetical protein
VIRFAPAKRLRTLEQRGLDCLDAETSSPAQRLRIPIEGETMVNSESSAPDGFKAAP